MERKRPVIARRPLQFPPRDPRSCAKTRTQCRHTFRAILLTRSKCVSSIRGKGNHRSILRQPCRYHLKGTCKRTSCEYWHPPECQFYQTEMGCKAGDKCLFPHYKIDEQAHKKAEKEQHSQKEEKAMTRMLWLVCKVCHNWVVCHKTRMHWFLKETNKPGETRCKKDRLVSIDNLANVNFIKTNRDAKPEINVCSRIMRLTNNQTKSQQERLLFP